MRLLIIALLVLVGRETAANPYPISPRPLRKLVMEAPIIVTGYVEDVIKSKDRNEFGSRTAILKIREVLQGSVSESVIKIPYRSNVICPAPPHYDSGTWVVVFLSREKHVYQTYALSYGVKTVTQEDITIYRDRIVEMQKILMIENKDDQFLQTVEWLVKCAEHPATRQEGTYELSPESDFMSYYDRDQNPSFQFMLTTDQKLRLKNALLKSEEDDYSHIALIDLVYADYQTEVFDYMLNTLKNSDNLQLWYAGSYLQRLAHLKTSARLKELMAAYEKEGNDYDVSISIREAKQQAIVRDFVTEIQSL